MESALQKAGIRNVLGPDGSLNGPEETLEPVTVGGRQWLQGSLCEQGNCGDHYLRFYIRRVRIRFWVSTLTVRHAGSGNHRQKKRNCCAAMPTPSRRKHRYRLPCPQHLQRLRTGHRQTLSGPLRAMAANRYGRSVVVRTAAVPLSLTRSITLLC